jgi:hypothetical protein
MACTTYRYIVPNWELIQYILLRRCLRQEQFCGSGSGSATLGWKEKHLNITNTVGRVKENKQQVVHDCYLLIKLSNIWPITNIVTLCDIQIWKKLFYEEMTEVTKNSKLHTATFIFLKIKYTYLLCFLWVTKITFNTEPHYAIFAIAL